MLSSLFFACSIYAAVFLPPRIQDDSLPQAALVILPGASIAPSSYEGLAQAIQDYFPGRLFVSVPDLLAGVPFVDGDYEINTSFQKMKDAGYSGENFFVGGHSLGGIGAQNYANKNAGSGKVAGTVLMASAIQRSIRDSFELPALMISGEYDGQLKPIRAAEALYHAKEYQNVVIVRNLTHLGFADLVPNLFTINVDFQPILTLEDGHDAIAQSVGAFLVSNIPEFSLDILQPSIDLLNTQADQTIQFLEPIIKAMEFEGSYHLKKPCDSDTPSPQCPFYPVWPPQNKDRVPSNDTTCQCGSPLMQTAQSIIAGLDTSKYLLESISSFHDVSDTHPIHHPHIWNSCVEQPLPCIVNATTVAQNVYDFIDDHFDATTFVSASEIRAKLTSRQNMILHTVDENAAKSVDINISDDSTLCRQINEESYRMALELVPADKLEYYFKYGTQYTFQDDITPLVPAGPFWINAPLKYNSMTVDGKKVVGIQSTRFVTALDNVFNVFSPYVAGYHYCKVLSPARVLEWVYTDSLRDQLGLAAKRT